MLPRHLIRQVISEIAVDAPVGDGWERVKRGSRTYVRRKPEHAQCRACAKFVSSSISFCAECIGLAATVSVEQEPLVAALANRAPMRTLADDRLPIARATIGRLFSLVKRDSRGCLIWQGGKDKDGYGELYVFNRKERVHKLIYELNHGRTKLFVCHTCDTPSCAEDIHLFPGTPGDNTMDAVRKGRILAGDRHPRARLTEDDVREARQLYATGEYTYAALARKYRVTKSGISLAVLRYSWRHIR